MSIITIIPKNKMAYYNTIAESNNFIVLDDYEKYSVLNEPSVVYQTESSLEREFIQDLVNQGYEYLPDLNTPEALLANVRVQLQVLNDVVFTDSEWDRYVEEYLDKPSDSLVEKTRKLQDDYIYDFVFDDGHIKNIYLVDKHNLSRNKVQVIKQFIQEGTHLNRYDVTILVNGLPLVQVELKKEVLQLEKHSIRYIDIQKRVLTLITHYTNIFRSLLFLMALIAVILPIQ